MSYPEIAELSTAFTLCTCSGTLCSPVCQICYSPKWRDSACVQQLWREHTASDCGKAAAQAFDNMCDGGPIQFGDVVGGPTVLSVAPAHPSPCRCPVCNEVLTDREIVERTIDFAEQLGIYMEPWQANALRAILLHGGDVVVGRQH